MCYAHDMNGVHDMCLRHEEKEKSLRDLRDKQNAYDMCYAHDMNGVHYMCLRHEKKEKSLRDLRDKQNG